MVEAAGVLAKFKRRCHGGFEGPKLSILCGAAGPECRPPDDQAPPHYAPPVQIRRARPRSSLLVRQVVAVVQELLEAVFDLGQPEDQNVPMDLPDGILLRCVLLQGGSQIVAKLLHSTRNVHGVRREIPADTATELGRGLDTAREFLACLSELEALTGDPLENQNRVVELFCAADLPGNRVAIPISMESAAARALPMAS